MLGLASVKSKSVLTTYRLIFLEPALKEWGKLDSRTRNQFKSKLGQRLSNPRVPGDRLSGEPDRYKIKLRSAGYRLVYEVREAHVVIAVIAVGKRDKETVYRSAAKRGDEREMDEPS